MGSAPSSDTDHPGVVTVSGGRHHDASEAYEADPILANLRALVQELPSSPSPGSQGIRDAALQEDTTLSALVKDASEALAADVGDSLSHYQSWASGRQRQVASKQLLLHQKLDEAEAKAVEAGQHVSRLIQVASGIDSQLDALAQLPQQVESLCSQLQALQQQTVQLQARAAAKRAAGPRAQQ